MIFPLTMGAPFSLYFHYEHRRRLCSTTSLLFNLNQPVTWHIRKCSYQPNTERVALSQALKRRRHSHRVSCFYFNEFTSAYSNWKMTADCIPWENINSQVFSMGGNVEEQKPFFFSLQSWDLNDVKIGMRAEVRPVLVRVTHDKQLIMILFLDRESVKDAKIKSLFAGRWFDNSFTFMMWSFRTPGPVPSVFQKTRYQMPSWWPMTVGHQHWTIEPLRVSGPPTMVQWMDPPQINLFKYLHYHFFIKNKVLFKQHLNKHIYISVTINVTNLSDWQGTAPGPVPNFESVGVFKPKRNLFTTRKVGSQLEPKK